MSDPELYAVFAEFARTHGAAAAADRFKRSLPELAETFRKQFEDDLVRKAGGTSSARPILDPRRRHRMQRPRRQDVNAERFMQVTVVDAVFGGHSR
ncbi:hypothetical protein [Kribbella sp. C-35]|uniref:hypothetical protein n=1 Tax=Kribbella sp. C-35 TaxID=2789276 RepID=UPI00397C92F6